MKKLYLFILSFFFLANLNAQFFQGLRSSPYGGVTNVGYNPAIADSRFKADINLINLGFGVNNNYIGIDRRVFLNPDLFSEDDFQNKYLKEHLNGKDKFGYVGFQTQLPFSFMFSWGKKTNKNALALTYNINHITNIDNFDQTFAQIAYYGVGFKADSILGFRDKVLTDVNPSVKTMTWVDYGITYSRVLLDKEAHMVKFGGTVKLLQGITGGYAYVKDLEYRWDDYDTLSLFRTKAEYRYSNGLLTSEGAPIDDIGDQYKNFMNFTYALPSIGVDLGVVYEWRPDNEKYKYTMDCEDWWRFDKNRYKLAAGLSIVDIGAIPFKNGQYSGSFEANIDNWYVGDASFPDGLQSINDTINSRFTAIPNTKSTFTLWLPTRINMFLDYHIWKGFGINAAATISPNFSPKRNSVHHVSNFSITPKYDHAWFGLYLPVSYDLLGNFNFGTTLRLGPLVVGTQDLLGLFAKKNVYNADIHLALKIPIPYGRKRDRDKDGVSNRKDDCKKEKGNCASHGCPDHDGDGIVDMSDDCPDVPGLVALRGCPDTDGDGIVDREDSCVTIPGLVAFNGCPDVDKDGVPDRLDDCPTDSGSIALKGCPDRDNDGVADREDKCPDVPGATYADFAHFGCPDTDGDGLYDYEDRCVQVTGPKQNFGCPYPDTDGDGVVNKDDECPKVPGVPENKGCPQLDKKEIETVKFAFENLEFETSKDIIRKVSYPSLNGLADLLVKKANYGLRIEGNTDNVGSDENNLILSQKRANAVKAYLVKKGVTADKLDAFGFGESNPIATNETAEGRQKNRRVEMTITFK